MHTWSLNDKLFDRPQNGWKMQYFQWHSITGLKLTRQAVRVFSPFSQSRIYKTAIQKEEEEEEKQRVVAACQTTQKLDI